MNEILEDKDGNILDPKIPRYEKLADYTLESNSNEIIINNLNIKKGMSFKVVLNGGTTNSSDALVNVILFPNNKETFNVARVAGIETNAGSINNIFNLNTSGLYIARIFTNASFKIDANMSWELNYLRNLSDCGAISSNTSYNKGSLYSIVNLNDTALTSIKIKLAQGQFISGTNVKLYRE